QGPEGRCEMIDAGLAVSKPKLRRDRNQFATQCLDCGSLHPPDSGFLYEKRNGRWFICCDQCAAKTRKPEPKPQGRLEERKAAWRQFRKRVFAPGIDGLGDRPPWKD